MSIETGLWLAMGAPPGGGDQAPQSPVFMFVWIGLMLAIIYMMMIRPQQRREKERRALLAAVKSGDRVVFAGGVLGVVTNVKEKTVVIKMADNVKVEALRGSITQVLGKEGVAEEQPSA